MTLYKQSIPKVSREFALDLKRRFRPMTVKPGFDRDKLMESVGEQNVVNWILHASMNTVVQSTLDISKEGKEETGTDIDLVVAKIQEIKAPVEDTIEDKGSLFKRFTSRFGQ